MGYTWQDVMLGIDVQREGMEERKQQQAILDKQAEEAEMMGWAKLGSTLLCGALFGLGPAGAFVCSQLSRTGVDLAYNWEYDEVDAGKFYKSEAEEFRKTRDEAAEDQTKGQVLDTVIDLATMYVQAGGLEEGMDADFTTYGAGEGEWSVFGRGDAPIDPGSLSATELDELYRSGVDLTSTGMVAASADYVPSLFSGGFKQAGKKVKSVTGPTVGADQLKTLAAEYYSKTTN